MTLEHVVKDLYAYWQQHPEDERGTCKMISESSETRLSSLFNVPTIDLEMAYHAAQCAACGRKLGLIANTILPKDWHDASIVVRLAEIKRRMNESMPKGVLKIQQI